MVKFEKVSRFKDDEDVKLPRRATAGSAGYDFYVAEDIVLPPYDFFVDKIRMNAPEGKGDLKDYYALGKPFSLDEVAAITKELKSKIPLVSTGVKCYLNEGQYLELSVRSSTPYKHWICCGNGVGIIDRDYADNKDNEGEIYFQLINFFPFAIELHKGDKIGQGIIKSYGVTDEDNTTEARSGGFGSTSEG